MDLSESFDQNYYGIIPVKEKADQMSSEYGSLGQAISAADDLHGRQRRGSVDRKFWWSVVSELVSRVEQ